VLRCICSETHMTDGTDSTRRRYLEARIVFCVNCDGNRQLHASSHGLVCGTCTSVNWMYLPNHLVQAAAASVEPAPDNLITALIERVEAQQRERPRLRLVG